MEAKPAGVSALAVCGFVSAGYRRQTKPQESGKRRKSHPTTRKAYFYSAKRGLPKTERRSFAAMGAMRNAALNIRHGNRVPIVVSGRESRLHGEGEQFVLQYK